MKRRWAKSWTIWYVVKTKNGPRIVTIRDGRVFVSYLPSTMWSTIPR